MANTLFSKEAAWEILRGNPYQTNILFDKGYSSTTRRNKEELSNLSQEGGELSKEELVCFSVPSRKKSPGKGFPFSKTDFQS